MKINIILFITIYSATCFDYPFESSLFSGIVNDEIESFDDERIKCDLNSHCAGVAYLYDNSESYAVSYSFLPNITDSYYTETYRSSKSFTLHRGRVSRGSILSHGSEGMTVNLARYYCHFHPSCVAFFYPVHSLDLTSPDNITFVSSLNEFDPTPDRIIHDWYTFISNDISKAKYVNESSLELDVDLIENPFPRCCKHSKIPSMEEIEAVDTFERIPCNISRSEFIENYEMKRRPVMLVGCDKEWKAKKRWKFEELMNRFENDTFWRGNLDDEEINNKIEWRTIVDRMTNEKNFYIFDPLDREHQKVLYNDYSTPFPLKGADLYEAPKRNGFPSKSYGSMRWFCLSNGKSGTYPHNDPVGTDAWNSLVAGHKWWIIFPQSVEADDGESMQCSDLCSPEIPSPLNWFASVGVNIANLDYPGNFNDQRPMHILQKPGETIYVPNGYIHAVYNIDENVAVTANFGSIGNFEEVWEEIVTSGNPQHWQQVYYQEFDDKLRELARRTQYWPAHKYALKVDKDECEEDDEEVNENDHDNLKENVNGDKDEGESGSSDYDYEEESDSSDYDHEEESGSSDYDYEEESDSGDYDYEEESDGICYDYEEESDDDN